MNQPERCPLCEANESCHGYYCVICFLGTKHWPAVQALKDRFTVESMKPLIAEYLIDVNADHENDEGIMFIPPTAIPWLAAGAAKRIVERGKNV